MATLAPPQKRSNLKPLLRRAASDGPTNASQETASPFRIQNDDTDGEELAARYQMLEELGSGSFGIVYKAIEKTTGEIVAVKHVSLETERPRYGSVLTWKRSISSPQKKTSATSFPN